METETTKRIKFTGEEIKHAIYMCYGDKIKEVGEFESAYVDGTGYMHMLEALDKVQLVITVK